MEIEYLGIKFKPIGNIVGGGFGFKSKFTTREYEIKKEGYKHEDFYKVAKKHHCSCDIYESDGKLYIPCTGGLMGLTEDAKKHIKYCEDYDTWYKWAR